MLDTFLCSRNKSCKRRNGWNESYFVVNSSENGNIDIEDLKNKANSYKDNLAALMITYPSTHGVFESDIKEITETIHKYGGMVYMDGANMNAQVGLTDPTCNWC